MGERGVMTYWNERGVGKAMRGDGRGIQKINKKNVCQTSKKAEGNKIKW